MTQAKSPDVASLPLVLLLGSHSEPIGPMKHLLESKFAVPTIAASADTLTLLAVRMGGLCRKYSSIRLIIISLRDFEGEAHQTVTILLKAKLPIFAIIPLRKKLSSPTIDLSQFVTVRTFLEQHENHMEKLAEKVRELLNITTSVKASPNGNTSYAGGIARPPRNGGDEFVLGDEDAGADITSDTDFSTIHRGRGRPRKVELDAIESGVTAPKTTKLKPIRPPKATHPTKGKDMTKETSQPGMVSITTNPQPHEALDLRRRKKIHTSATCSASIADMVRKFNEPMMQIQSAVDQNLADRKALLSMVSDATSFLQMVQVLLISDNGSGSTDTIGFSAIHKGKTVTVKTRRKYVRKTATAKAPRRGKGKKKKLLKPTHQPGQKLNGQLRKGAEVVKIEGEDIVMSGKTAWALKQFLVKQKAILPDKDLLNNGSNEALVQRLIGIREALDRRYGTNKGRKALVTHHGEGHSLDLSLAH